MKKFVKGLSIVAASALLGAGIGVMAGCSATDGKYVGEFHYISAYGPTYGMVVEVTVKDNIITKVRDLTNSDDERAVALQTYADKVYDGTTTEVAYHEWHEVSAGWESYYTDPANSWLWTEYEAGTTVVDYTIVTTTFKNHVNPCTINISVDEDGKITKYEVAVNGSTTRGDTIYKDLVDETLTDGTWFVGKGLSDILAKFGGNLSYDNDNLKNGLTSNELATGATQTSYVFLQAAAFATANAADPNSSDLQYTDVINLEETTFTVSGTKIPTLENGKVTIKPEETAIGSYAWTDETAANWSNHLSWLLQQYVGLSVKEVLDMNVYTNFGYMVGPKEGWSQTYLEDKDSMGEPYGKDYNTELNDSGLLVTGSTQGSGRLALAIQNALKK